MPPTREDLAAELFDLHARFAADRARGGIRSVEEYVPLFPGLGDEVRAAHAAATTEGVAEPEAPLVAGPERRLGRYRILRELGRGGQGAVHLAEDTQLGRRVALKMLTGVAQFSSDARKRFQREAETASRLDHSAICTIYESGFEGELAYIAMRFVEGETLSRRLARVRAMRDEGARDGERAPCAPGDRAELADTLRFFEEAARALHAAHEAGVIHRDVKPGNLMVSANGGPVILDFGLARALESTGESITHTGDQVGTPSYMSPEQIDAQGRALDRRTDVYSLGVTLYECLTLEAPFQKPTLASLYHAILREPPRDPRSWTRSIPRELVVVLEPARAEDSSGRYTTSFDLAEDLRRVRELQPIRARPASLGLRTLRWVQRHPARTIGIAAFFVIAALGAVTWAIAERRDVIAADLAANEQLDHDREVEDRLLDLLAATPMRGTQHDWRAELEAYVRALSAYGVSLGNEDRASGEQVVRAAGARDLALKDTLVGALRHVVQLVAGARRAPVGIERAGFEDLAPAAARGAECSRLESAANTLVERLEDDPWRRSLWTAFHECVEGRADALDGYITDALVEEHGASDCLLVADLCYPFRAREVVYRLYDAAERKPSDDPNVRYAVRVSRGLLRHQLGNAEGAWIDLRAACDVRPRVASIHQVLSRIAHARGDCVAAEEHAGRAVELDENDANAWMLLANACASLPDLDRAVSAATRALALEPRFANARELLGNLAWSRNEEDRAFEEWDRAAEVSDEPRTTWKRIGSSGLVRMEIDALHAVFARVGARAAVTTPIWIGRARAAAERREWTTAIAALRAAREDSPADAEVARELGTALCASGARVEGIALLREAATAEGSSIEAQLALAVALLGDVEPRRARPALERVLELDPHHADAARALAGLEFQPGGDPKRAAELLDGIPEARRTGEWCAMRSQAHWMFGAATTAIDVVFTGLERFPRDPILLQQARGLLLASRGLVGLDDRLGALCRAQPKVAELVVLHAFHAWNTGDHGRARTLLDRAATTDTHCSDVHVEAARWDFEEGRFGASVTQLRRALALNAAVVATAEERARELDALGAFDASFDLTSSLLDCSPSSTTSWSLHARAAFALGLEAECLDHLRRLSEHDAERADLVCLEAQVLDRIGDPESARKLLTSAIVTHPNDPGPRRTMEDLFGSVVAPAEASTGRGGENEPSAAEWLLRREYTRAADGFLSERAAGRAPKSPFDAARAAARAAEVEFERPTKADAPAEGDSLRSVEELAEFALHLLDIELERMRDAAATPLDRDALSGLRARARRLLDARDLIFLRRPPRDARWAERAREFDLHARALVRDLSTRKN